MITASALEYGKLLSKIKPEVVSGEAQNQAYIEQLEKLIAKKTVSSAEKKLIGLLTVLVEDFENQNYPVPEAGPLGVVRHLMEGHNLRQKDLVDVFGTESIVSDVLNGKRDLAKEHIRRLSRRFHVSPSVFF